MFCLLLAFLTANDEPKPLVAVKHGKQTINALAFDRYGKLLASASEENTIRIWTTDGMERQTVEAAYPRFITFSPDAKQLLAPGFDDPRFPQEQGLQAWEVETGKKLPSSSKVPVGLSGVLSADGGLIVIKTDNRTVKIFEVTSAKVVASFVQERTLTSGYPFMSPDNKTVAETHFEGTVVLWDVKTGKQRAKITGQAESAAVRYASFSPDSKELVCASQGNSITMWDVATGKKKITFTPHEDPMPVPRVHTVLYSPDGKMIASGGSDGTVRLSDTKGKLLATLRPKKTEVIEQVVALAFTADGRRLASGSHLGTVTIWDLSGIKQ